MWKLQISEVNVKLVHFSTQYIMNHIWPLSLHNFFFLRLHSFGFPFFVVVCFVTFLSFVLFVSYVHIFVCFPSFLSVCLSPCYIVCVVLLLVFICLFSFVALTMYYYKIYNKYNTYNTYNTYNSYNVVRSVC